MLKYNFKEGKVFRTTLDVKNEVIQSMMGQEMKVLSNVAAASELKFTKVDTQGNGTSLVSIINASTSGAMGKEKEVKKNDFKRDNICIVFSQTGKSLSNNLIDSTEKSELLGAIENYLKLQRTGSPAAVRP